ncbi:hypothetical protein FANTH_13452 [Fusarium anthophilum]|uniref:Carrier domain-containing protein n=1 Tax=Fusarium anthophilum TaxID=48485 RepID=A0A8H4YNR6_9HYPO|nr:hypothetical protein FANTH_13452 [Fusarium anthophilum]
MMTSPKNNEKSAVVPIFQIASDKVAEDDENEYTFLPIVASSACRLGAEGIIKCDLSTIQARENVTVSTIIRAAWAVVLGLTTKSERVVFGATTDVEKTNYAGKMTTIQILLSESQEVYDYLRMVQAKSIGPDHPGGNILAYQTAIKFTGKAGDEVSQLSYPLLLYVRENVPAMVKARFDSHIFSSAMVETLLRSLQLVVRHIENAAPSERLGTISMAAQNDIDQAHPRRVNSKDPVELTPTQRRAYIMEQLYPGCLSKFFAVRIRGPLDVGALRKAITLLETRHDILRTRYIGVGGKLVQVVESSPPTDKDLVVIQQADLEALEHMLNQHRSASFDLQMEPAWRKVIYRLSQEDHVLSFVTHQIACDARSLNLLRQELPKLYAVALRGLDSFFQTKPLSLQYRYHAAREHEHESPTRQDLEQWAERLQTGKPAEIHPDSVRHNTGPGKASLHRLTIDGLISEKLAKLGSVMGAGPSVLLLAAFAAAVYRITGVAHARYGVVDDNRRQEEFRETIGPFSTLSCVEVHLEDNSFEQLIQQLQQAASVPAIEQETLEKILWDLRDGQVHSPLVRILFALHDESDPAECSFEGLDTEEFLTKPTTSFDLEVQFYQHPTALRGEFIFSSDIYKPSTIREMEFVFLIMLERALSKPTTPIQSLSLLPDARSHSADDWVGLRQDEGGDQASELLEIQRIVRDHASVEEAIVFHKKQNNGETDVFCFVTMQPDRDGLGGCHDDVDDGYHHTDHVEALVGVIDANMYKSIGDMDPDQIGRDFSGWTSMLDGKAIDYDEMNEWLDETIETIRNANQPKHILELGMGSGMILFNLGSFDSYIGIDPSAKVVELVQNNIRNLPALAGKAVVQKGTATDIDRLNMATPPTLAIINSVCQYFPSQEYFFDVIKKLLLLPSITTIFLGDIRSHATYREFCAAKALHSLGYGASRAELGRMMDDIAESEMELLVDPAYFITLQQRLPHLIEHVEILPKKMKATNELSCYRYTAVIHVNKSGKALQKIRSVSAEGWIDFSGQGLDRKSLSLLIEETLPRTGVLAVGNIPHRKTIFERCIVDALDRGFSPPHARNWILTCLREAESSPSMSATDLVEVAQQAGCRVELSWARQFGRNCGLDAIFHRFELSSRGPRVLFHFPVDDDQGRPQHKLTTHPFKQHLKIRLQEQLHQHLHKSLPAYMVPRSITILNKMPVDSWGQIDRLTVKKRFLEVPKRLDHAKPWSFTDLQMRKIWSRLLTIPQAKVGPNDDFFKLGGDSLAALQLLDATRKIGLELTVRDIFHHPRLQELGRLAVRAVCAQASSSVAPFSLIKGECNVSTLCSEISNRYKLDPGKIEDVYPCTALQERLLFHGAPGRRQHRVVATWALKRTLCVERFREAWLQVFQESPVLRSRFFEHDELGFLQVVLREEAKWMESENAVMFAEAAIEESTGTGCALIHYMLLKNDDDQTYSFLLSMHCGLLDDCSVTLLFRSVQQTYESCSASISPPFEAFVRYSETLDDEALRNYWFQYFEKIESPQFPPVSPFLEQPLASEVCGYQCSITQATLNLMSHSIVCAAWAFVSGAMSGSDDVVFATVTPGRKAPIVGVNEMLGSTSAITPMRVNAARRRTMDEYLFQVENQVKDRVPFEQAKLSKISPNALAHLQTLVTFTQGLDVSGTNELGTWRTEGQFSGFESHALIIQVSVGSHELMVNGRFDPKVLSLWIVEGLLRRLVHVLDQMVQARPDRTLAGINVLCAEDKERIWQWNSPVPTPLEEWAHLLFEERVRSRPEAPAICAWDGDMTYQELDQASTALSARLGTMNIAQGSILPLCFEKSKWTLVALLAVLKGGWAFALMDPRLPYERLKAMARQLEADVILSSAENLKLSLKLARSVIQVDEQCIRTWSQTRGPKLEFDTLDPSSTIMFCVFSSGTTGMPKATVITHTNFCSSFKYQAGPFGFEKDSRVLDFASYAYDAAIHNALVTVLSEGCLCIPCEHDRTGNLAQAMRDMRVTFANLTPTVARLLDPLSLPNLRTLVLAGEAVSTDDVTPWWGKVRIVNAYGPSECTIASTINGNAATVSDATKIGKGIGLLTWVVDPEDHQRLLPPGCTGELLLEGPLVGCGYLGDSGKTTMAFIESPLWLLKGIHGQSGRQTRLYKTGDLVRYDQSGNLSFVGRKDNQVKINGQRVELEEIEHYVQRLVPGVKQLAAEVIPSDGQGSNSIVVVFFKGGLLDMGIAATGRLPQMLPFSESMKRELAKSLPQYMIPNFMVSIDDMPLAPTGKRDGKRLRSLAQSMLSQGLLGALNQPTAPLHDLSTMIQEGEQPAYAIATKVFSMLPSWGLSKYEKHGAVSVHTDISLHLCGFDSVSMMSLLHFINRQFNVKVGMDTLMAQDVTIRSLANVISGAQSGQGRAKPTSGSPTGDRPAVLELMNEVERHDSSLAEAASAATKSRYTDMDDGRPKTVFLTGASGYIGTQILRQLIENRRVHKVIALVRGKTLKDARDRVIASAVRALWWTKFHSDKLEVWKGDLSLPQLGLDPQSWYKVTTSVNAIIHNGAVVHWSKGYRDLEAPNVGATIELLSASVKNPSAKLVYVTGGRLGVSADEKEDEVARALSSPGMLGYSQTKFVAEALVRRAARRDELQPGRIKIVSPGLVVGTPTEGVANADDYLWRLLSACIRVGAYNADIGGGWISISDASTVASLVVGAAVDSGSASGLMTVATDGMKWDEICAILVGMGFKIEARKGMEWRVMIRRDMEAEKERHPLWPIAHLVEDIDKRVATSQAPVNARDRAPAVSVQAAIMKSAAYLYRVGFLPQPEGQLCTETFTVAARPFTRSGL